MPKTPGRPRRGVEILGTAIGLILLMLLSNHLDAQLSTPPIPIEPESEPVPRPKGPTSMFGSAAIILANMSMIGFGTVLSYIPIRSRG